jgi:hypothetical protein
MVGDWKLLQKLEIRFSDLLYTLHRRSFEGRLEGHADRWSDIT